MSHTETDLTTMYIKNKTVHLPYSTQVKIINTAQLFILKCFLINIFRWW